MKLPSQLIDIGSITATRVFEIPPGSGLASVTADGIVAAWTVGVLTVKWGTNPNGPFYAFASTERSAETIGPGEGAIAWVNLRGKRCLAVEVTTAEAATPEWVRLEVEVQEGAT
jgi:hypothetical protein